MTDKPREIIVTDNTARVAVEKGVNRDGVGMWTHAANKHAQANHGFADHDPLTKMVKHERYVIARLERRAREARENPDPRFPVGRSPTFLGICSRLQKTRVLLTRLEAELRRATA
jgi:hypothetical protein